MGPLKKLVTSIYDELGDSCMDALKPKVKQLLKSWNFSLEVCVLKISDFPFNKNIFLILFKSLWYKGNGLFN